MLLQPLDQWRLRWTHLSLFAVTWPGCCCKESNTLPLFAPKTRCRLPPPLPTQACRQIVFQTPRAERQGWGARAAGCWRDRQHRWSLGILRACKLPRGGCCVHNFFFLFPTRKCFLHFLLAVKNLAGRGGDFLAPLGQELSEGAERATRPVFSSSLAAPCNVPPG